jgi:hypothetical protein
MMAITIAEKSERCVLPKTIRYRCVGTFPPMYQVAMHLILENFEIISTSAFPNISRYPKRYIEMSGKIRNNGGFDFIILDKNDQCFIGVEFKPEFSQIEFEHAFGQTLTNLRAYSHKVDKAMIIMPHKNLPIEEPLKKKFSDVLHYYCGHRVTMKYLKLPCKRYISSIGWLN